MLGALKVPASLRLTPAGLRAGGAVYAYRQDLELQKLLWKMRLTSLTTLQHYVQELGADSIFVQLPEDSRTAVTSASSFFDILLTQFSRDGSP